MYVVKNIGLPSGKNQLPYYAVPKRENIVGGLIASHVYIYIYIYIYIWSSSSYIYTYVYAEHLCLYMYI